MSGQTLRTRLQTAMQHYWIYLKIYIYHYLAMIETASLWMWCESLLPCLLSVCRIRDLILCRVSEIFEELEHCGGKLFRLLCVWWIKAVFLKPSQAHQPHVNSWGQRSGSDSLRMVTALLEWITKWAMSSPGRVLMVEPLKHIHGSQQRVTWTRKFNLNPDVVL